MTATTAEPVAPDTELAPVCEDFSAYIIAGAVSADATKFQRDTEGRTPAQGIQDGVDAERPRFVLGLGRGDKGAFRGMGIPVTTTKSMIDSAKMTRRLWAGESVAYEGQ